MSQQLRTIHDILRQPRHGAPGAYQITGSPARPDSGAPFSTWTMLTTDLAVAIDSALTAAAPPDVTAAVSTLTAAWAPAPAPGHQHDDDADDDYDYDDGCGCAGEDQDGRSLGCNCATNCICESCALREHHRFARCMAGAVSIGTRCTMPTRYRITAYRVQPQWTTATAPDAVCAHPPADGCPCAVYGTAQVSMGARPVVSWYKTACSPEHALDLVTAHQARGIGLSFHTDRWAYAPHDGELPDQVATVRTQLERAAEAARCAALAVHGGRDEGARQWWLTMRWALARAAGAAVLDPGHPGDEDDDDLGPAPEEPDAPWGSDSDDGEVTP
ncbi:hypothetical protein [Streptomyces uncialis]|uniref:hypothetical protein n=1 Tax=Streptomyces uncialis TaxID=1048205 RepID=UPI003868B23C|nr:hypothetical protein OG924_12485 [Streptomyces uncialis]